METAMPRKKRPEGTRAPNGASSIYYSEYWKCWVGKVTMGVRDNGKPDRRTVKRQTETEIIRAVRDLERQRDAGKVKRPGRAWSVEKWLTHWLVNIVGPSVRPKTAARYRTDIMEYLIPGLGAHRIDKLRAEHVETLYAKLRSRRPPLSSSSIYHVHATLRAALNEATRRKHIVENPVLVARSPQLVEPEIVPLTLEEAQRILDAAGNRRNGVRFALALGIGLRQGEAIGLKWGDLNGVAGTLTVRRALQRQTWRHGCDNPHACGAKRHKVKPCRAGCKQHTRACPPPCPADCAGHARHCPQRQDGGLVEVDTKSAAGRRVVSVPKPLLAWLERQRKYQGTERATAGTLWQEGGWIFTQPTGRPIDPRADYQEWRDLLTVAGVRPARLHDARHTAATMLLVLKVPVRAAMDVLGWSDAKMASRYMHVPDEMKREIAGQVAGLLWSTPADATDRDDDEPVELTDDQRAAIRLIATALPAYWRRRLTELLGDDGDGSTGVAVPA
jgi:integrase